MFARLRAYYVMTKPRAMFVVLVTAAAGYLFAVEEAVELTVLFHLLVGAGLAGGGSIVLNQVMERDHDRKMERTQGRPMPTGQVTPLEGVVYGVLLSVVGTLWLWAGVNAITAILGALCVLSYVLLYTPLKRKTTLNTAVGAVPGAIPPMMGWTAATGEVGTGAWLLFLILFVWQFPHFLAIAWIYKDDYARAGYRMLSGVDPDGSMSGRQAVINSAVLLPLTMLPASFGLVGWVYTIWAVAVGMALLGLSLVFAYARNRDSARYLLRGSIIHISLLMILLVLGKV